MPYVLTMRYPGRKSQWHMKTCNALASADTSHLLIFSCWSPVPAGKALDLIGRLLECSYFIMLTGGFFQLPLHRLQQVRHLLLSSYFISSFPNHHWKPGGATYSTNKKQGKSERTRSGWSERNGNILESRMW